MFAKQRFHCGVGIILYVMLFFYMMFWWKNIHKQETFSVEIPKLETFTKVPIGNISSPSVLHFLRTKFAQSTTHLTKTPWRWSEERRKGEEVDNLLAKRDVMCDGRFVGHSALFAHLTNVVLDQKKAIGRKGGENITDVINQKEEDEYFQLSPGYFSLYCQENRTYTFTDKSHLNIWYDALRMGMRTTSGLKEIQRYSQWTIAVQRYEYANLYHTMTDYYNAFLLAKVFQLQPDNITILWIDGHPVGALDDSWTKLFGKVLRAGEIEKPLQFDNMLWGIMGYDSPLNHHNRKSVSYLEEFRRFFLTRHGVSLDTNLNCDNLTVTFLWRRNYLAHPRNPSGSVSRKIKNEDELLSSVKTLLPQHNVVGLQIDKLPMDKQLLLMSQTDILIGMHGAGLSHTLFLPSHGGLIELYPNYWPSSNQHFRAMAKWRHLEYLSWSNTDRTKELSDKYTIVEVDALLKMVKEMTSNICRGI